MLTSLRLTNFKSFREAKVRLSPLSLVLGGNGAGKSNLFDALRLLSFLSSGTSIRDAIEGHATSDPTGLIVPGIRGGGNNLPYFGSETSVIQLGVDLTVNGSKLAYDISVDTARYRIVGEKLRADDHPGQYVFSTHEDMTPSDDPDAPAIGAQYYTNAPGRNPRRDFSPHSSILSQFEGRRAHSNLNEEMALLVRTELSAIQPLELHPDVLRQYAPIGRFEMGEHGENFPAVVWYLDWMARKVGDQEMSPRFEEQLSTIESWLNELTPHPIQRIKTINSPTNDVLFAVDEVPFSDVTARSLSDGTLRFAALAVALFGRPNLRRILLIEEIENGINPARLQLLIRMIEAATAASDAAVQVIASTHSPGVLNWANETTLQDALVIGWDSEKESSNVVRLRDVKGFETARQSATPGELQAEGWFEVVSGV